MWPRHQENRRRHSCNGCRKQFSVRTGTIFQKSRIPLHKWLYAMYVFQVARKGISSVQLGKELGITQRSAWYMLHRLRESMDPGLETLSVEVEVEVDEAYVARNREEQAREEKAGQELDPGQADRSRLPRTRPGRANRAAPDFYATATSHGK